MRRSGFGWWRLAKQVVLGAAEAVASFANTTFTAASATGTADGSTANTLTLTLRDSNNAVMPFKAVTFTTELTAVSASQSTLVDDAAEIATTTGTLNLILTVKNADGTPLPNIQSSRIVYASTGSNNTFGTPTVTNASGQSLCTFSSTTAEAKTISVTVDGVAITQTAAVTVTGTPSGVTLLKASRWAHGAGSTEEFVTDNANFDAFNPGEIDVIASTGLDFPTGVDYVLRMRGSSSAFPRWTTIPVPGTGESLWYRWYMRSGQPDGLADNETHPVQDGNAAGDTNWMFKVYNEQYGGAGTWSPELWAGNAMQAYPNNNWDTPGFSIPKNTTVRVELQVHRLSSTTYNLHIRIYDDTGTLLVSDADFYNSTATATLADDPVFTSSQLANLAGLNMGFNGVTGAPSGTLYGYQSAVAVSADGWIGAFVPGESA